jgi:esterase/lipase superfamily enzyme
MKHAHAAFAMLLLTLSVVAYSTPVASQPGPRPGAMAAATSLVERAKDALANGNAPVARDLIDQAIPILSSMRRCCPELRLQRVPQLAEAMEVKAAVSVALKDASSASTAIVNAKNIWDSLFGRGHPSLRFAYRRLAKIAANAEASGLLLTWPKDGSFEPASGPLSSNLNAQALELTAKAQDPATEQVITTKGGSGADSKFERYQVFYGTTRKAADAEDPYNAFGYQRAPLRFGVITVSIPDTHELGEIEAPSLLRFEFRSDPEKHMVLWDVKSLDRNAFRSALQQRVLKSRRKEAFVFVHGYNTTFAESALRTAQMAFDLEVDGPAVMFSWPSRGSTLSYIADNNECNPAAFAQLKDFLQEVAIKSGATSVNVLAHSMGNCFLTNTMAQMTDAGMKNLFNQVVFAAADVDPDVFRTLLPKMRPLAKGLTLYSSANDYALLVSEQANGIKRVGDAALKFSAPGVDTVDASAASAPDDAGHSYFAGGALGDVRAVIWHALNPTKRCVLKKAEGQALRWNLSEAACDNSAFRLAVLLLRRTTPEKARQIAIQRQQQAASSGNAQLARVFANTVTEINRMTN